MRYVLTIIAIAVVGIAGFWIGRRQATGDAMTSAAATRPRIPAAGETSEPRLPVATVIGLGKLLPHGGLVNLMAPPGEQIRYAKPIEVGDVVTKGQPLYYLHSRALREKDLELAQARRSDTLRTAELEKDQLRLQRDVAKAALAEAMDGLKQLDLEQYQIYLLEEQFAEAQNLLQRTEALKADPDTTELVSLPELEQQRLAVEQLKVQLEQARSKFELAKGKAERSVQLAQAQLNAAETSLEQADQMVPVDSLNAAVELAETALAMTEIRSPIDGRVLDVIVADGDSATNRPVVVLGDTSQMDCMAEVNDSLLGLIHLDQYPDQLRARITSDALPRPLWGTVEQKGVMISPLSLKDPNPFARVDRRVGTVTIHLDDPLIASQFIDLQVDIEIETAPGQLQAVDDEPQSETDVKTDVENDEKTDSTPEDHAAPTEDSGTP